MNTIGKGMPPTVITEALAKNNDHIPTDEIVRDIADTQREVDDYQEEKVILMRNPPENRVRIYMLEGKISQRENFISTLKQILEYRKKATHPHTPGGT
jgi:hypothetical protein